MLFKAFCACSAETSARSAAASARSASAFAPE
nr:MAG TPA: hypothetical protein [Caudoviricetes sp.]